MPTDNLSVTSSIVVTSGGVPINAISATPPSIAVGEPNPGRVRVVTGAEGDDALSIEGGATAIGGGGADVFTLVSSGIEIATPERLGVILDYDFSNDSLDLAKIGPDAVIVSQDAIKGGARIGIDYDGDGKEDGYVLAYAPGPNGEPATILPEDDDGGFTILPFPMPTDDGVFTILPYPMLGDDGVFTIQPFPMPGDGAITLGQIMQIGAAVSALDGWSV